MRAFQFRLHRLLSLREAEKQQRVLELAECRRAFDDAQRRLRDVLNERDRVTTTYRHLGRSRTSVWTWIATRDALQAAESRVATQARAAKSALDDVERSRERLMEKSREVETYHRLRDKQRQQHDLQARRAEQKSHDDVAVERHLRSTPD